MATSGSSRSGDRGEGSRVYVIEHRRGSLWWDGERWRRGEQNAKIYTLIDLPVVVPIRNGSSQLAQKTDLRYRIGGRGGEIVASCWPTLKRVVPEGVIEYGWICAVCQRTNDSHLRKCEGCDTERGCG